MPLTDTRLRQLKAEAKPYKVSDGGGLYVLVNTNGSKLWRLKYRFDGKEKVLSFGSYPDTTLARARERRGDAKTLLADGIDPSAHAKAEKEENAARNEHTFANIANELVEKLRKEGKAETTLKKKQWLLDKASEDFGNLPIRQLTPARVLETVRKVGAGKL